MYPTVPHLTNRIGLALQDYTCQDTPRGDVTGDFMIKGLTEEFGSYEAYRASIFKELIQNWILETSG